MNIKEDATCSGIQILSLVIQASFKRKVFQIRLLKYCDGCGVQEGPEDFYLECDRCYKLLCPKCRARKQYGGEKGYYCVDCWRELPDNKTIRGK